MLPTEISSWCKFVEMEINFSGWEAVEEKRGLRTAQEPTSGRVYTMFHGTYLKNAEEIIANGFQRSRDGLLGAGVYVSRNIDKAKCYPHQADKKDAVVFKLSVRVGKVKRIDSNNHPLQKTWHLEYDCAWVPPNSGITSIKSGREEDCVWDPARIQVGDIACCIDDETRHKLRRQIKTKRRAEGGSGCICHQASSTGPHPLQNCWKCNKQICPFQKKHECPNLC